MASLDDNGDGVIDADDTNFANLSIWQDANANGVTDAGELQSLADHGITSISAPATPASAVIDGQDIVGEGTFTRADGSSGGYVEVALETAFGSVAANENELTLPSELPYDTMAASFAWQLDTFVFDSSNATAYPIQDDFLEGEIAELDGLGTEHDITGVIEVNQPLPTYGVVLDDWGNALAVY